MADTIEYYISNFEGEEIELILNQAKELYRIIYENKPENGIAVFMSSDGENPAWRVIPHIEEVKI